MIIGTHPIIVTTDGCKTTLSRLPPGIPRRTWMFYIKVYKKLCGIVGHQAPP